MKLSETLSCARSVLSCQRCKSNGVCIIYKRYKNSEEALEAWLGLESERLQRLGKEYSEAWIGEVKRLASLEPKEMIKRLVICHLRWLCKVVRERPDQLGLCEEQKQTALVSLDELLRLCTKEEG
jgi:hypothetical protein